MLIKWLRNRRDNKIAEQMERERITRQNLLDSLRKSVDEKTLHRDWTPIKPGRNAPVRPTTISREHFELLECLGASTEYLKKLRPIVRD